MYLDLCTSLGTSSLKEGTQPKNLTARIDSALDCLHTLLGQQIGQARSILSKTRNEILSPATCLPEEVLAEIFTYVVFSYRDPHRDAVATMEEGVNEMYRSLHNLLGVCCVWKNVVMTRGEFWSTIPFFESSAHGFRLKTATDLSIERASHCNLGLAAVLVSHKPRAPEVDALKKHASLFHTINITSQFTEVIREIVDQLAYSESNTLSELSIRQIKKTPLNHEFPEGSGPDHGDVGSLDSSDSSYLVETQQDGDAFSSILGSLSILRVSGTRIEWDYVSFSDRLTTLRLQVIHFGYDDIIIEGLSNALSSATGLQVLEIISVLTFPSSLLGLGWQLETATILPKLALLEPEDQWATIVDPDLMITLPNLQTLLIQDLHYNTLINLLASIAPGSHRLTLYLTDKCENHYTHHSEFKADLEGMYRLLKTVPVHKLCIEERGDGWLSTSMLRHLLKSLPELETLRMDGRKFSFTGWNALKRPRSRKPSEKSFPHLVNLHLNMVELDDENPIELEEMVASYSVSLRQMVLGGLYWEWQSYDMIDLTSLREDHAIVVRLREKVPDFKLAVYRSELPELQQTRWQLW